MLSKSRYTATRVAPSVMALNLGNWQPRVSDYEDPGKYGARIARILAAAAATAAALLGAPIQMPSASADPCPDVDVVFARGTNEPPGVGPVGQAFVDALRPQLGDKSLGVYGVNYPATTDFNTGVQGIDDAAAHITDMATTCPQTKMVLGGFSQGAAVMGFVTAN